MNGKPALRYHATDFCISLLWYYGILIGLGIALFALGTYLAAYHGLGEVDVEIAAVSGITMFYLFVAGLYSYKADFFYLLQNGISRRTQFVTLLIVGAVLALLTGVIDLLLDELMLQALRSIGLGVIDMSDFVQPASAFPLLSKYIGVVFLNGSAFFVGLLITTVFYRLNTLGKILLPIGVFGLLVPALSFYDHYTKHLTNASRAIDTFVRSGILSYLLIYAVFLLIVTGLTWLLQRRAQIKSPVS